MINFWLKYRFRVGKRVKYNGFDVKLLGKPGKIVEVVENWIEIIFDHLPDKPISVEKEFVELI